MNKKLNVGNYPVKAQPASQAEASRGDFFHSIYKTLSRPGTAGVIVALGVIIRLLFLLLIAHQPLVSDAASYNDMSLLLRNGTAFVPYWPPGLPLYLSVVHLVFGDSIVAVRVAMLFFYVLLSFFVFRTAVALTGETAAGNIALLILALSPATILASIETWTELPAATLLTIIAYCLLRARTEIRLGHALLLGAAIGWLALTRPSSLVLLLLVPVYLLWRTRKFAGAATVFVLGALIVGTWIGYVDLKTGRFVKINAANSKNIYWGNNPNTPLYRTWWWTEQHLNEDKNAPEAIKTFQADLMAHEEEFPKLAMLYIRQHPGLFLLRTFNRICVYFSFNTFVGSHVLENYAFPKLAGFGLLALDAAQFMLIAAGSILYLGTLSGRNQRAFNVCLLLGVALVYALPYFLAFSHPRFHYPIEPILTILCSAFLVAALSRSDEAWETIKRRKTAITAALVLFALVQIEFFVMMTDRMRLHS